MTEGEATSDDGPDIFWAFHGADHGRRDDGSRPNGASGHVVCVVRTRDAQGHTTGFYTIEAMGRAYGVVNGSFWNRGWTGYYRIPGVADRPPAPPVDPKIVAYFEQLDLWRHRCYAKALKFGDRDAEVTILNRELRSAHFLLRILPVGNAYGKRTRTGVYKLKLANPGKFEDTDGESFGGPAADVIVQLAAARTHT